MHPRTLAIDPKCSGGSCPAVYDDDPDLLPDELGIVGSSTAPNLRARIADRIAIGEELVVIKRELVEQALQNAAVERVGAEELSAQFETFSYSAFRLETLQHYADTGRDDPWIAHIKAARRWRKIHQRVHVVVEPLTRAMEEELTLGYEGNVAAGEDIRIIPTGPHEWPGGIPEKDFWLFDSSRLYVMQYEPDGTWAGADHVTIPASIVKACAARDAALHRATPWRPFIAARPELQRRVAR